MSAYCQAASANEGDLALPQNTVFAHNPESHARQDLNELTSSIEIREGVSAIFCHCGNGIDLLRLRKTSLEQFSAMRSLDFVFPIKC